MNDGHFIYFLTLSFTIPAIEEKGNTNKTPYNVGGKVLLIGL